MNNWGGIDFFIFLIFVLNTVLGMSRGASKEIISMICLNVALIFIIKFTLPLSSFLDRSPLIHNVLSSSIVQNFMTAVGAGALTEGLLHELNYCLSVLICFAGAFCTCEAVLAITDVVQLMSFSASTWNRKVGGSLGFIRGYIINVVFILVLVHLYYLTGSFASNSYFIGLFKGTAQQLDGLIMGQQVERYKEIYENKGLYNEKEMLKSLTTEHEQKSE